VDQDDAKSEIGYPFLQEAKVTAVSDEMFKYIPSENGQIIPVPHGPAELANWKRKADKIENHYSKRMGIVTGPVEVMFHVDMLKGMRKMDDGAIVKEYDKIPGVETDYAAQTIVWNVFSEDQRFLEQAPLPVEEEFPEGSRGFFLGEFNYGRPLEVIEHNDNRVSVWIATMVCDQSGPNAEPKKLTDWQGGKEPEFAKEFIRQAEKAAPYIPSYRVARQLGLNPLVLSKITSSFQVLVGENRVNLGLNLKFEAKKLKVLGYSRKNEGGWEFSTKAIDLLKEYMQKFPKFFQGIMRNPHGDLYHDTDFFDPSESKQKIDEIKDWLKSIDSKGFEKVPLEAQQLDQDVVMKIEQAMDQYDHGALKPKRVNNVPRNALLKPLDAEHRLADQRFALGDRVVYVQDSGKVPIASRGTVIGITRTTRITLLDIVWDITFMSGTTLGNRCSPFRGMTVPVSSVLNVTSRQLIAASKASNTTHFKPVPPPAPLTSSYANATMGDVSNVDAPSPQHYQQQNGFRGGRGGRGRGGYENQPQNQVQPYQGLPVGPARGGFAPRGMQVMSMRGGAPRGAPAILQRGRGGGVPGIVHQPTRQPHQPPTPQQVVPYNPQPGQYQNVPPPASLNQRGGRGGRSGRGGNGRGRGSPGGFRGRGGGPSPAGTPAPAPAAAAPAPAPAGPQEVQGQ
jgi:5'-3' exoribonuclease 1